MDRSAFSATTRIHMAQRYKRPPITEAVIEIRPTEIVPADALERAARRIGKEYYAVDPEAVHQYLIEPDGKLTRQPISVNGYRISSVDRADMVAARPHAFSCSRLAPYLGWDNFRGRAARDWDTWKKSVGPRPIARIGVRFINRIDVRARPDAQLDLGTYLKAGPQMPEDGMLPLTNYTFQITRPVAGDDFFLNLGSASVPSPLIGHASLLLDIDIYREKNLPMRDEDLWGLIDQMRVHKNRVFELCVTDAARQLFEPE